MIAGGAEFKNYYYRLQEMADGDPRIIFTGFVFGEEIKELYSNAYLFVMPSNLEGMANSLLEAMSYGNCCLVSDIPENTEVVGDHAVVFKKGNVKELCQKLKWLLDSPDQVARYRAEAAPYILKKYNWDYVVEQMLDVYSGNLLEYKDVLKRHHIT